MSKTSSLPDRGPGLYEIRLTGRLDARRAAWFDDLVVIDAGDGMTVIRGQVEDQSALHGLLQKVRDLGIPLISVVRIGAGESTASPVDAPPPPRKASP